VDDLGPPIAATALQEGTPVYDRARKKIGVVEEIVGDPERDIFDGILIHTLPLPGRHRLASVDQISDIRERGVLLGVGADALHDPDAERSRRAAGDPRPPEPALQQQLRHAWDRLTGARR
jgi:hypothetical protein